MLHPDALGDRPAQATAFQGAFRVAEQVGHSLFGDFVDVTGAFGFHGMVSMPRMAAEVGKIRKFVQTLIAVTETMSALAGQLSWVIDRRKSGRAARF
ncbi:hypothetical protein ACIQUS_12530 [Pseudomonas sp. NPDC090755]|uniref:hypothetical protein n=1 Tax=Pseudomonas sp. NPDC090755 TaxID=3364481 RepID=UPI00383A6CFA